MVSLDGLRMRPLEKHRLGLLTCSSGIVGSSSGPAGKIPSGVAGASSRGIAVVSPSGVDEARPSGFAGVYCPRSIEYRRLKPLEYHVLKSLEWIFVESTKCYHRLGALHHHRLGSPKHQAYHRRTFQHAGTVDASFAAAVLICSDACCFLSLTSS